MTAASPARTDAADGLELAWREHGGACLAVARGVLEDGELAEGAVRQAFVDQWLGPPDHDRVISTLGARLVMATHRHAVARVREDRRHRGPDEGSTGIDRSSAHDRDAVLARVPAAEREVLVLMFWGGYDQTQVAHLTGSSLSTVRRRTRRALELLSRSA